MATMVIDEKLAEFAHYNMSMRDYKPNTATNEWHAMCAEARELADAAIKRAPNRIDEIERLYERYERKAAEYINEDSRIGAMCPSVLVCGPANFPTKKKQRQIDAWDRHYESYGMFDDMKRKLRIIGTEREAIKSGDADAIERLEERIEKRSKEQELMKLANKWYRKYKDMAGFEPANIRSAAQKNLDFEADTLYFGQGTLSEDEVNKRRAEHMAKTKPFASWQLSNNNAEIRRLKKRVEKLKAEKAKPVDECEYEATICGEHVSVFENTDNMRLQLLFDGKPSVECRTRVKASGFRWAPSQKAWQRQLTNNARYALKSLLD